jgi:hypothetical protein
LAAQDVNLTVLVAIALMFRSTRFGLELRADELAVAYRRALREAGVPEGSFA